MALSAAAALGRSARGQAPTAPAVLDLRVGASPNATYHIPAFVAVDRGIFSRNGLNPRIVMYPTGVEMVNGLLAGAQEVNVMATTPFVAGVANGQPLVLIGHLFGEANRAEFSEGSSIIARAGITEPSGLRGKRIGVTRGTSTDVYLRGILAQNGIGPRDVTIINLTPPNTITALRQGDVDAIAFWEPGASQAELRVPGATRLLTGGCTECYDPGTLLTTRSIIAEKAEHLRRFWLSFAEAAQWMRQNLDGAAELAMRWIPGVDLDIMKRAIRVVPCDPRLSRLTGASMNARTIPPLLAERLIPRAFDANTAIDPQFYLYAQRTAPQFFSDLPPIPESQRLS
jgi:NitT/TauT family transport system substrate-binding protein/sulfonate transport system substrate-binding protein